MNLDFFEIKIVLEVDSDVIFHTACFVGKDLFQRMIGTFGIGRRVKKCLFGRLGWDFRPKTSVNPSGHVKNASGKMCVFGPFWGPLMAISCPKKRPCFDIFPTLLCFFVIDPRYFYHVCVLCVKFSFFGTFSCFTTNTTQHTNRQHTIPTIHNNNKQHTIPTTAQHTTVQHITAQDSTSIFSCVLDDS